MSPFRIFHPRSPYLTLCRIFEYLTKSFLNLLSAIKAESFPTVVLPIPAATRFTYTLSSVEEHFGIHKLLLSVERLFEHCSAADSCWMHTYCCQPTMRGRWTRSLVKDCGEAEDHVSKQQWMNKPVKSAIIDNFPQQTALCGADP